jgi:hypothetical protein
VRGKFAGDVSGAAVGPIFTVTHDQWRQDQQRLPTRRRKINLAHRAKTLKPKTNIHSRWKFTIKIKSDISCLRSTPHYYCLPKLLIYTLRRNTVITENEKIWKDCSEPFWLCSQNTVFTNRCINNDSRHNNVTANGKRQDLERAEQVNGILVSRKRALPTGQAGSPWMWGKHAMAWRRKLGQGGKDHNRACHSAWHTARGNTACILWSGFIWRLGSSV